MRTVSRIVAVLIAGLMAGSVQIAQADVEEGQLYLLEAAAQGMAANCTCGEDLNLYERCLKKQSRAALKAFKASAKFLDLAQSGLKEELGLKVEDLVLECEFGEEDPDEDEGDEEEF